MTIAERLVQLLVPDVIPALYPQTAPDGIATPYTTYILIEKTIEIATMTLNVARLWMAQFNTYSESFGTAFTTGQAITQFLHGYSDDGINGIVGIHGHSTWDDISKCHGWIVELQITEHLS